MTTLTRRSQASGSTTVAGPGRGRRALTIGRVSTIVEPRLLSVVFVLLVGVLGLLVLSLSVGDFPIALAEVVPAVFGYGTADADFIVRTLRLPRALTGALVGMAFGLSGAVFQRITRNVLASPDIIGITAGASAGAVFLIIVVGASSVAVTAGALAGGLVTATTIYLLAWRNGISGFRLVLIGIGFTAALTSVIQYLLTRAEIDDATRATVWLTGSLNGRGWDHVVPVALALAVLVPLTLSQGRGLRALQLGDDAARGLGVRADLTRSVLIVGAVLLAAVATASAGPIAFVALAAPPVAKQLCQTGGIALVPAMLVGACIVLAADLVAQHVLGGLPVGVATALVGAPYLLFLLSRANRIGSDG
jgi:iron complex transport system permease protein